MKKKLVALLLMAVFISAAGKAMEKKDRKKTDTKLIKDPFVYSFYRKGEAYIPADDENLPSGISITGIIITENGKAMAIIRVPGYESSFFVEEKTIIRLDRRILSEKKNVKIKTPNVYLEILKISSSEVELIQKKRPDRIYTVR
jgi:hypothetical protein